MYLLILETPLSSVPEERKPGGWIPMHETLFTTSSFSSSIPAPTVLVARFLFLFLFEEAPCTLETGPRQ